jgi:hypothetical protein
MQFGWLLDGGADALGIGDQPFRIEVAEPARELERPCPGAFEGDARSKITPIRNANRSIRMNASTSGSIVSSSVSAGTLPDAGSARRALAMARLRSSGATGCRLAV